jgi:hypothetical protein
MKTHFSKKGSSKISKVQAGIFILPSHVVVVVVAPAVASGWKKSDPFLFCFISPPTPAKAHLTSMHKDEKAVY